MAEQKEDATLKLVIFGDAGTGKTTLAHRYMTGLFKQNKLTLGVQFHVKRVNIVIDEGEPSKSYTVKLQIWDFGGEKRFRFLLPPYCRGAQAGLFLYDVTNKKSLENVADWTSLVLENAGKIPIMLVGAKADLEENRQVSREEGMQFAEKLDLAGFVETSSKNGQNVEITFETAAKLAFKAIASQGQ
ncbi:MAG: GTP-binding protein [Candidatus Lokiarchaeota archaeon]|nr:GTP-binding protein [Candidatus Lokiarchaeota archaeon]